MAETNIAGEPNASTLTTRGRRERPPPTAIDNRSSHAALRTIATLEAIKGIAILLVGFGLLSLLHKDVQEEAENLLIHLHMNPDRRFSQAILNTASRMTDGRLWAYAGACVVYTTVRFTEAYGLWNSRVWAEWFALLSGALYLPWELVALITHPSMLHWALILINLVIVLYMIYVRVMACRPPNCTPLFSVGSKGAD